MIISHGVAVICSYKLETSPQILYISEYVLCFMGMALKV